MKCSRIHCSCWWLLVSLGGNGMVSGFDGTRASTQSFLRLLSSNSLTLRIGSRSSIRADPLSWILMRVGCLIHNLQCFNWTNSHIHEWYAFYVSVMARIRWIIGTIYHLGLRFVQESYFFYCLGWFRGAPLNLISISYEVEHSHWLCWAEFPTSLWFEGKEGHVSGVAC